ncbi:MAG: NAD-binding protein [Chloroflexi bacterium]|nr:NAD-binding protein [Chloroflexota bacterium]MCY4246968.1 NAD-binding protein [Chloroflexota bacterium]
MNEIRRQFRAASILILIVIPVGILGYMLIENRPWYEAVYLTIITLTTIGFGDIVPTTPLGQLFTLVLVFTGLGALAFFLSSSFALTFSAEATTRRRKMRNRRKIARLSSHYIICGGGEMVDKTIGYVLNGARIRHKQYQDIRYQPIESQLRRIPGGATVLNRLARKLFALYLSLFHNQTTLLDLIVVITEDSAYAEHLRSAGILVMDGDPSDDNVLLAAGVARARALMVMLDQDAENLLTVLSARNLNSRLYITADVVEGTMRLKMIKAGANVVLAPYEVASQFLNSATLRPAVSDFFNSILFDQETQHQITQLELEAKSPWIGRRISDLQLAKKYDAGVIGIRLETADFLHSPDSNRVLQEDEILLCVAPGQMIPLLQAECLPQGRNEMRFAKFQRLAQSIESKQLDHVLSLDESERAVQDMTKHFIICGDDHIIESAVRFLDPARPFVLVTNDAELATGWQTRGFRVILGDSTRDRTLRKAGIERAQAIMISKSDRATAVLTVISARSISKSLLISVTATTDDMIDKLWRSGADRVVSPFHVAAQFVLLSTTRPEIAEFLQHVLYNEQTQLETAEFYMEDDSPWIGKTLRQLALADRYQAGVIGIRRAKSARFVYAPPLDHQLQPYEVLIVITPMRFFDTMREEASGHINRRPATLRLQFDPAATNNGLRDMLRELLEQHDS